MSTFVNNNVIQTATVSGTLGVSTGKVIYTNTVIPGNISSINLVITSTATAGSRLYAFNIFDGSGNLVWRAPATSTTPASTGQRMEAGAGVNGQNLGGVFLTSLPASAYFPPNGTLVLQDLNNIDVNDSIAAGQIVVQY
jgi:hypothetical protein